MPTTTVQHAERMMTHATWGDDWVSVAFADGRTAKIGLSSLRDDKGRRVSPPIRDVTIPDPYLVLIEVGGGEQLDLPWDYVRHFAGDEDFLGRERRHEEGGRAAMGARIKQVRESVGLSQSETARRSKVGRVTLNRIEQGGQTPSYATLQKLSEAFGVPLQRLLLG